MNKLKTNILFKWIVGFIQAISILAVVVSGIVIISCINENIPLSNSAKFKEDIVSDLMEKKLEYVRRYYYAVMYEDNENIEYYKDYFSEENSNYFFNIKKVYTDDFIVSSSDGLYNYKCDDYQYMKTTNEFFYSHHQSDLKEINIFESELCRIYEEKTGVDLDDDYLDEYIITYVEAGYGFLNIVFEDTETGEIVIYDLLMDDRFLSELSALGISEPHDSKYYYNNWYYKHYGSDTGKSLNINVSVEESDELEVEITSYIKSDLQAKDDLYYVIKYGLFLSKNVILICVISIIFFVISSLLLAWTAGHKKGKDGITLNKFDRIPLDILLVLWVGLELAAFFASFDFLFEQWDGGVYGVLSAALLIVVSVISVLIFALMFHSIASRIKAGKIYKNTIIYKCLMLVARAVKFICMHINICWKIIIIYWVCALFEIFCACASYWEGWILLIIFKIVMTFPICYVAVMINKVIKGAKKIADGDINYKIDTKGMLFSVKKHAETLNSIGVGMEKAVSESMKSERMKTELITNVSHDIKTPITSIISYVDLLKKENLDNEKAMEYVEVLDRQSERLKKLIQDLIDVSKASTGNMTVEMTQVDIKVLIDQILGEMSEKLQSKGLKLVINSQDESLVAFADGRHMWRAIDNLMQNIYKYALENSRVYIDLKKIDNGRIEIDIKNISGEELNITGDELMERFVRGDKSRNTEGSGLGLSIAKSLMEIQGGTMNIIVDGDLFKVILTVAQFQ